MTRKSKRGVACFVVSSISLLAFAASLAGCGGLDQALPATLGGAGGQMTTTGMVNDAGQPASGGQVGVAQAGAGGSTGGMGGSGVTVSPVDASCDNVAPCGGDVVGTWAAAGSCLKVSGEVDIGALGLGCLAAPVTGSLEVSGTWTANGDGTFSDQTTTTGSSEILVPSACMSVSGTLITCNKLGIPLQALGFAAVTCEDAEDGGCTCAATARQTGGLAILSQDASTSGMCSTADNVLTTTDQAAFDYSYCVSGNTLTVTPRSMSPTGTVTGTIVLQKQ